MEKNVKEFKITSEYYVAKAVDCEINGDIAEAVYCVRRAIDLDKSDLYLRLKLASYYEALKIYEAANDIYLDIIAKHGAILHCFYALCDNMYALGEENAANYYLRQYENTSETPEERDEIALVVIKHAQEKSRDMYCEIPTYVAKPDSGKLGSAVAFMRSDDYKSAIGVLDTIPIDAMDGIDALAAKAKSLFLGKKYREVEDVVKKVLAVDPYRIDVISTVIDTAEKLKDAQLVEKYKDMLRHVTSDDENILIDAAEALFEHRDYAGACEKCAKFLEINRYDLKMRALYGAALYNVGKYRESRDCFGFAMKIYDRYGVYAYYKSLAQRHAEKQEQNMPKTAITDPEALPKKESLRRWNYVSESLDIMERSNVSRDVLWQDKEFVNCLGYVLSTARNYRHFSSDDVFDEDILYRVAAFSSDEMYDLLGNLLMKCYIPDATKRIIVFHYAYLAERDCVKYVYDNVLCEVTLDREAATYPPVFREAYAYIVSLLGIITRKFERELKKVITKAIDVYVSTGKDYRKYEALAAAIVSSMSLRVDLTDTAMLCDIFECSEESMKKYRKELNLI